MNTTITTFKCDLCDREFKSKSSLASHRNHHDEEYKLKNKNNYHYTWNYYILYKTTNTINGKYYIGVHSTNELNDGYMGSGIGIKRAIKKYGKSIFTREILETFKSYEEMMLREKEIITEDFIANANTYNASVGGHGGQWKGHTKETNPIVAQWAQKVSKTLKNKHTTGELTVWNKGKKTPYAAENGKKSADKMKNIATGRKRKYRSDGSWTWEYPEHLKHYEKE